jgi:ribose 5-phosphate isomerase B
MPGRFVTTQEAEEIMEKFLTTEFEGGRHVARVEKIPVKS